MSEAEEGARATPAREPMGAEKPDDELEDIKTQLARLEEQMKQIQGRQRTRLNTRHNTTTAHGGANEAVADFEGRLAALGHQSTLRDEQIAAHDVKISMLETTTYDGDYLWKIDDFSQRLRCPYIQSPHFYFGRYGYKVCARMYLNGDGMGSGIHLSLFFVVMPGKNDAILPWPFEQKVTFKMIDQRQENHIISTIRPRLERPKENLGNAGIPAFVAISESTSRGYIKEDVMFVRITVDGRTLLL